MPDVQLILYDDPLARSWFPFTLTRPAGELRFGAYTIRERIERLFQMRCSAILTDPALADFDEPGAPPVATLDSIPTDRTRIFVSARAILHRAFDALMPGAWAIEGTTVGVVALPGLPNPTEGQLFGTGGAAAKGLVLTHVWELMTRNAEQLSIDLGVEGATGWSDVPAGVGTIGPPMLRLGRAVVLEPQVVLDFTDGPIWLDDGVHVRAFTRLAGPAYIGKGSTLFGGSYSALSTGPLCKIRGEIESTVILGFSNKAHDGFLGHAYLGKWVNLGALTTNSDLKNNYGPIRLTLPDGEVDTGELKIGCLLGDHVKTAIGTMLNTGTIIGPGSNIFGGAPAKFVPPFSWGDGVYDFDKFIATAGIVMARRKQQLTDRQRSLLQTAWRRGRALAKVGP